MPTIFKPSWVRHEGTPIYTVDIHPDGSKFATGGADNRALIWRLAPVIDTPQPGANVEVVPKLLCAVAGHEQSVNVVRWSPNGRWLATGSGDGRVGLAERAANPTEFGASAGSELWRFRQYLTGSQMEIWDLAWSPDSSKIAVCCHDYKVYVWDVSAGGQLLTVLKGHTTVVKGIVWDPIGTFLATQDDTSLIIWRADGWKVEKQIVEPFTKTPETIMFRRPSWSSDGSILFAAAAMISGTHAPLLIERERWTFSHFPVGHKALIAATAANPNIFLKPDGSPFLCYALADVHQILTVWSTSQENALTVIANGCDKPVTDLRWSPSGDLLFMASLDGSILVMKFEENEIGSKLSEQARVSKLREIYGSGTGALLEDPALLALYQERKQKQQEESMLNVARKQTAQQAPAGPSVQREMVVQGRRKIVPVLVTSSEATPARPVDPSDAFKSVFAVGNITPIKPTPTTATTPAAASSSAAPAGRATAVPPVIDLSQSPAPTPTATTSLAPVRAPVAKESSAVRAAQSSAMDVDAPAPLEKKRGRPPSSAATTSTDLSAEEPAAKRTMPPPASNSTPSKSSNTTAMTSPTATHRQTPTSVAPPSSPSTLAVPWPSPSSAAPTASPTQQTSLSTSANTGLISQLQSAEVRKPRGRPPGSGTTRRAKQTQATTATSSLMDLDDGDLEDVTGASSDRIAAPRLLLPLPQVARRFSKKIVKTSSSGSGPISGMLAMGDDSAISITEGSLEVMLTIDDDGIRPPKSTLKYIEGHVTLWQDHVEDKVTALTGNSSHLMAAGCATGDVYIYSVAGRRMFPAINIAATPICALECSGSTLMAVSCDGIVKVWDVAMGIAKADTNLHAMMSKHAALQVDRPSDEPSLNSQQQPYADLEETLGLLASSRDGAPISPANFVLLHDFISKFAVSETGQALCIMYSGQILGYSTMLASWVSVYAPNWQKDADKTGVVLGQLSSLQRTSQRAYTAYSSGGSGNSGGGAYYSSWHGLAIEEKRQRSVAHLESQVAAAALFGTISEYRLFAKLYVRELADLLHEKKLTEFINSLLGPMHHSGSGSNSSWDPFIHGVPKREILEEVLLEILRPELQRLIATTKEALQAAKTQHSANRLLRSPPSQTASSATTSSHSNGIASGMAVSKTNKMPAATPTNLSKNMDSHIASPAPFSLTTVKTPSSGARDDAQRRMQDSGDSIEATHAPEPLPLSTAKPNAKRGSRSASAKVQHEQPLHNSHEPLMIEDDDSQSSQPPPLSRASSQGRTSRRSVK